MEAAKDRERDDPAVALRASWPGGRVKVQGPVRPGVVVVGDELAHDPPQMSFVERDDVIQALAP